MRRIRVCIYGGTDLPETAADFISTLTYRILNSMPAVIVTGGFLHSNVQPEAISTDAAALRGARRYAERKGAALPEFFEAWIPEPRLDKRPEIQDAVRMSEEDGVTVRIMTGRTPLGRRLAMVAGVDVVVTISGKQHTEVVVEQALELGLPVLPIPYAGGDSKDLLDKYRPRIAGNFDSGALNRCLDTLHQTIDSDLDAAAAAVVNLLRTAKIGRCLILLPFDEKHDRLYATEIEPAVARHMVPLRLDRLPRSDAIYTTFAEAIGASGAIIADITDLNKNVMYEIGFAHGRGLRPLIFTSDRATLERLPVYFKTLNVRVVSPETPVGFLIEEYLRSFKTHGASG